MPVTLTLYHRVGCHLCEDMHGELVARQRHLDFDIRLVDIDGDAGLKARFDAEVPVLALGGDIICCHFLDEKRLERILSHG